MHRSFLLSAALISLVAAGCGSSKHQAATATVGTTAAAASLSTTSACGEYLEVNAADRRAFAARIKASDSTTAATVLLLEEACTSRNRSQSVAGAIAPFLVGQTVLASATGKGAQDATAVGRILASKLAAPYCVVLTISDPIRFRCRMKGKLVLVTLGKGASALGDGRFTIGPDLPD